MAILSFVKLTIVALLVIAVLAHPNLSKEEWAEHKLHVARSTEALGRCLELPEVKELHARMLDQRSSTLKHLRKARGIEVNLDKRTENYPTSSPCHADI